MLCYNCNVKMRKMETDYQYKESGLKNVILKGIPVYECAKCKEIYPLLSNVKELHKIIAQKILNKKSLLSGEELRFLRKEMMLKAQDLARILGVTKVTVSRWENERELISPACDRLVRLIYSNRIWEEKCEVVRPTIEKLEPRLTRDVLSSLCGTSMSIEKIFKNIKRRHIHSKIAIARDSIASEESATMKNFSSPLFSNLNLPALK